MSTLFRKGLLAVTDRKVVQKLFTEHRAGRSVATRFVAGESLDDAVAVARRLNESGAMVSLDHLGEDVHDAVSAKTAKEDYLAILDRIASEGLDANISIKLTQLGMAFDVEQTRSALEELATKAAEVGTSVTVDMEESTWTGTTIDLYETVQRTHGNLGIAVQAYLRRTARDLERLIRLGGHIRLCKGAYAEPADIAFQSKEEVDESFERLLETLMAAKETTPAVATHDERLIERTYALAASREEPFEFQMLYGIRETLQQEIVAKGYPLRVYVPYGSQWYPYLTRRLAERPANLVFFARGLVGK
ncbi:MAG: proline dehydrogenase [Gammaproteobacteria bacterium]|nr:proline dehydrogenase [Gammaproteobacteria bacterium]